MVKFIVAIAAVAAVFLTVAAFAAAPVWTCTPYDFTVSRTLTGFYLRGKVRAPRPGYEYRMGDVTVDGSGIGRATVFVKAPPEEDPATGPVDIDVGGALNAEAMPHPVSRLVIGVEGDAAAPGPSSITCWQIGGPQF